MAEKPGKMTTRSGKVMRRVFKAVILERDPGDISTIEDGASVEAQSFLLFTVLILFLGI